MRDLDSEPGYPQCARNVHGGGALDPDKPDSDEGFISDTQMRALNIVIRYTVHEALDMFGKLADGDQEAMRYCWFQLSTVNGYMESPGTPELEQAYNEVTRKAERS